MPLFLPPPGRVTVVVIEPARLADEAVAACLSGAERQLAASFHFEKDARHWRACRGALRRILGEALGLDPAGLGFDFGAHGKPRLAPPHHGLHFNLSHCQDLALVALCRDGPVGIDVEAADRAPSLLGCESAFCHPDEIAALPEMPDQRAACLLDLWTSKEALLKALGTGMSLPPESVLLREGRDFARDSPLGEFRLHSLFHPALGRHLARLAMPRAISGFETVEFVG